MENRHTQNLDTPEVYRRLDPEGTLNHLHRFPALCEQAWRLTADFKLPAPYTQVKKIVILGMGGSAIGGDLAGSLALNVSRVPVLVCRDYTLPHYVDEDTLVIASSYSGMTEETLSAFAQAFKTPAKKLAITTGGKLKSLCESTGTPVMTFDYSAPPRAALPYSLFIILGLLYKLGFIQDTPQALPEALATLNRLAAKINESVPSAGNPAKLLAQTLWERLPVIYGAGILAEVARRWKGQFNENSKTTAFYELFSELNHNAIVGYHFPEEVLRRTTVILLDSEYLHERVRLRYTITQQLLEKADIAFEIVKGEGTSALSQMLSLIFLGDYVSYYLALLNNTNPTTITEIEFLKNSLARQ
jgi:glucose/mannose-6-phosphate isomerase